MKWTIFVIFFTNIVFAQFTWSGKTAQYILDGGTGNGSAWDNALDALPATLVRNQVYYIGDGIYSGYVFNDAVSGTDTIFVIKATESDHGTDTGWSSTYGDGVATVSGTFTFTTSYWFFSGQQRTTWQTGYGFKISTGQNKGINVVTGGVSDLTFQYIEIEGVGDDEAGSPSNDLLYQNADNNSNINVQYCYFHDAGRTIFLIRALDEFKVEYSYLKKNESTAAQHAEGISASFRGILGNDDCIIRHNIWEDIEGTGFIVFRGDSWEIYGNLFFNSAGNNGGITTWSTDPGEPSVTNAKVYNNTIVDGTGYNQGASFAKTGASPSGNVHYNNLYYGNNNVNIDGCTSDYNAFESSEGEPNEQIITSNIFSNYISDNFTLNLGTDAGINLGSPYNTDWSGDTRGADGTWDRGFDEYGIAGIKPDIVKNVRIIPVGEN